jgi:HEAT repeat protein
MYRTMGGHIEVAGLIVIADTGVAGPDRRVVLTVRESLKGTAPPTISLRQSRCPYIPEGKGLAVLLSPVWSSNGYPVVKLYTDAASIALLRELVPIYRLPSERQRLEALKSDPRYLEQLFDDLRRMRERGNYPILTDLYPRLDKAGRLKVIHLIGDIGDSRGVPVLLKAAASDTPEIRGLARTVLSSYFPAAAPAGVLDSRPTAENARQRAVRLAREGHQREARPLLLAIAADNREDERSRLWSALEVLPQLDAGEKGALRREWLPLLDHTVREGDYLQRADAVTILRALPHRENLELLIAAIGRNDFLYQKTPFQAAMALRELGPEELPRAIALLAAMVQARAKEQGHAIVLGMPSAPLLALAWLGGEPERTGEVGGDDVRALSAAGQQPDEGAYLVSVLCNPGKLPPAAIEWIVMRLGDLRDVRAIDALVGLLGNLYWALPGSSKEALIRIGGVQVEAAAVRLLEGGGPVGPREAALTILHELKGAEALPQLRAALADSALRSTALLLLARAGTEADLSVLIPMSDFWTGDRDNHYWAMQAVVEIRQRNRRP